VYESIPFKLCVLREVLIGPMISPSLLFRLYLLHPRYNNDAESLLNAILSRRDMLRDLLMALIAALIIELSKNVMSL
jgi:hypothetical protein